MKNIFFITISISIFCGLSSKVNAQANINLEQFDYKIKSANTPKFIEGIEIKATNANLISFPNTDKVVPSNNVAIEIPITVLSSMSIENCKFLQFKYALLMNSDVEAISNIALYNFIENWWGTRYLYGGSDKKGIDCSAFSGKLLSEIYNIVAARTAKEQYQESDKITIDNLKEGDLVFFNTRGSISHVGVYLGNNYFVHSSVQSGVTISTLHDGYYKNKFISGGRIHPVNLQN